MVSRRTQRSREILGRQPVTSDLQAEKKLWEPKGLLSHFNSRNKTLHIRARVYKWGELSGRRLRVINSAFGKEFAASGTGGARSSVRVSVSPALSSEQRHRRNQRKSLVFHII